MIAEGVYDYESVPTGLELLRDVIPRQRYDDPKYVYTTTEVLAGMEAISERLSGAGLEHLESFNDIYLTLTARVIEHIEFSKLNPNDPTSFKEWATVEHTIGIFADFWWKQLRAFTGATDETVDPAWQILLYRDDVDYKVKELEIYEMLAEFEVLDGVLFLIGMNAHINFDLPQALRASGVTEEYYEDYRKVIGMLINEIATKCSSDYIPGPGWTRSILQRRTERIIARWREQAWEAGKDLMGVDEGSVAMDGILKHLNRKSVRNGKGLVTVGDTALRTLNLFSAREDYVPAA